MSKAGFDSLFAERGTEGRGGVLFDEYVFYSKYQVMPRYIIYFERKGILEMSAELPFVVKSNTFKPGIYPLKTKSKTKFDSSSEALHYRYAESQFYRMCQGSHFKVTGVDYCYNPELESIQTKFIEDHKDKGGDYEKRIVFHGTPQSNLYKIVEQGFKVGGQGVNAVNGTAHGTGVYTSEGPELPSHYSQSGKKMLFCSIVLGRYTKNNSEYQSYIDDYDSFVQGELEKVSVIVLRSPKQIVPMYIVTFE
eukprot:TRINITY_DN16640_c0_g3_i1.p2 TRINITY_DN16640_c0_g3~~TRINITY_DN16640_c0_g3_i1.p2  ORF type:complete len:250 (-),score=19.45 TRINITY_DN16640_c0_g3_i1:614-1363(-)